MHLRNTKQKQKPESWTERTCCLSFIYKPVLHSASNGLTKKKHAPFWQHKQTFTNIKDLRSLPMKNGVGFCARRNPGRAPVHKHPTHRHSGVQLPVHPRRCTSCQSPPGIEGTGSGNAQFKSPVGTGHGCEALLLTEGSCFDAYWISQSHTGFPSHCKLLTDGGDGGV